jgi:hypothetical protein
VARFPGQVAARRADLAHLLVADLHGAGRCATALADVPGARARDRDDPRSTSCAMVGGDRRRVLEGLTIRVGACWALADDGAPGHPASVAPPILRLGHLAAPDTWRRRETPANMHRAGLDGLLLSSSSVWWRGDVDEDRSMHG